MKNNESKKLVLKVVYNILLDKKRCENILIHNISDRALIGAKPLHIIIENMIEFTTNFMIQKSGHFS